MNGIVDEFHQRYKIWKEENRYTQEEISKIIGCKRPTIGSYESGRTPLPNGETTLKMVQVLFPERVQPEGLIARTAVCSGCGRKVPGPADGASHCMGCGTAFGRRCANCDAVVSKGSRFCSGCGEPVGQKR